MKPSTLIWPQKVVGEYLRPLAQTPVHPLLRPGTSGCHFWLYLTSYLTGMHLFDYCGRPVCTVEVCGIIVRLERREKFSAYTGINFCWNFYTLIRQIRLTALNWERLGDLYIYFCRKFCSVFQWTIALEQLNVFTGTINGKLNNRQVCHLSEAGLILEWPECCIFGVALTCAYELM